MLKKPNLKLGMENHEARMSKGQLDIQKSQLHSLKGQLDGLTGKLVGQKGTLDAQKMDWGQYGYGSTIPSAPLHKLWEPKMCAAKAADHYCP